MTADGYVTAIRPGKEIFFTSITNESNQLVGYLIAIVYVKLPDGVYRISNQNSYMYLENSNQCILEGNSVTQTYLHGEDFPDIYQINQLWKIQYIGNGAYIIRSYQSLDMCMASEDDVVLKEQITRTDIPDSCKWTICSYTNNLYLISNSNQYLQINNSATTLGAAAIIGENNNTNNTKWNLTRVTELPEGILLYNAATGRNVSNPIIDAYSNSAMRLESYGYKARTYSPDISVNNAIQAVYLSENNDLIEIRTDSYIYCKNAGSCEVRVLTSSTQYASVTFHIERLPDPDLQNKTLWCWAAAAKKVGEHNEGSGALATGADPLTYVDGIDFNRSNKPYGETYYGLKTADAGQREIVTQIKGTDRNYDGSQSDAELVLQLASNSNMNITTYSKTLGLWWSQAAKNELQSQIENNNYVYISARVTIGDVTTNHAFVVERTYEESEELVYDLWNPFYGNYLHLTETELFSSNYSSSLITYFEMNYYITIN